jgi:uncharacterized radical SAM superfamily protein
MKSAKKVLCSLLYLPVLKMDKQIRPTVPTVAKIMERPLRTFSMRVVLGARRPRCRSHRSERNAASRKIEVKTQPTMKRGWRRSAPTFEM